MKSRIKAFATNLDPYSMDNLSSHELGNQTDRDMTIFDTSNFPPSFATLIPWAELADHIGEQPIIDSGIGKEGRDFSYLADPLVTKCLIYANQGHYGVPRSNGKKARIIHELWCAHQIHNDKALNDWLDRNNTPRKWAIIGMILHDSIENRREHAEDNQQPFDEAAVLTDIKALLNDAPMFDYLSVHCFPFMTDQPGLHGKKRIDAQRNKAYDKHGKISITYLQQAWRVYDKLSHVVFDARYCVEQFQAIGELYRLVLQTNEDYLTLPVGSKAAAPIVPSVAMQVIDTALETLKITALKSLKKAINKSFAFKYPAAKQGDIYIRSSSAMRILGKMSGSLAVDLKRSFRNSATETLAAFYEASLPRRRSKVMAPSPVPGSQAV